MPLKHRLPLALALALVTLPASAQGHHAGAHVHGVAELNVALEGEQLAIELLSPAANLLGFEHAPRTAEERAHLERTVARLRKPAGLFGFDPKAGCVLAATQIESPLLDGEHEREGHEDHQEIHAAYRFHCAAAPRLRHIDVHLFEGFPAMEAIEVQFAVADRQGRTTLRPGAARLAW